MLSDAPTLQAGEVLRIAGEEARHALRVKRLTEGQRVQILDGMGQVADGTVVGPGGRELAIRLDRVERIPPLVPRLEVYGATPKGPRVDELIRGLSQIGAASWSPLSTSRGVVSPRETKIGRLGTIAREAAKQCGRAWVMELGTPATVNDAMADASDLVVADAGGEPYEARGAQVIRLLVGPEGGWTGDELGRLRDAGARVCTFGAHIMRIEVAGVVAGAIIMNAERGEPPNHPDS